MTRLMKRSVRCGCCGAEQTIGMLMSTNRIGPTDLDHRPPPDMRHTMHAWLQQCEACLYVSPDISTVSDEEAAASRAPGYLECGSAEDVPELARTFLRRAYIEEATGDVLHAAERALCAAWIYDDRNMVAADLRLRAAALFARVEEPRLDMVIRRIDVLRRAGAFQDAVAEAESLLDHPLDPQDLAILQFQRLMARENDSRRYTFDYALRVAQQ